MSCNCNYCNGYIYSTNPARNTFNECENKCIDIWDGNIEVNKCYDLKEYNNVTYNCDEYYRLDKKDTLINQSNKIREIAYEKSQLAQFLQNEANAYYEKYKEFENKATTTWQEYDQLLNNAKCLLEEANKY